MKELREGRNDEVGRQYLEKQSARVGIRVEKVVRDVGVCNRLLLGFRLSFLNDLAIVYHELKKDNHTKN